MNQTQSDVVASEAGKNHPEHREFQIQIDRTHYTVTMEEMTGSQLRDVPPTPIGPDRDLFEVVPGGSDIKIADNEEVEIRNGLRFFTAPTQINPGMKKAFGDCCLVAD